MLHPGYNRPLTNCICSLASFLPGHVIPDQFRLFPRLFRVSQEDRTPGLSLRRRNIFSYRNKSSSVIWLWITPLYFPLLTPYVVIIVVCKVFLQFVILRKASSLFLKIMSYSLSITYSFIENFISHTLMTLSRRSISKSICAPGIPLSSFPCVYHTDSSESTPEIPSLFFICEI